MVYSIDKSVLLEEALSPYSRNIIKSAGLGTLGGAVFMGGLGYHDGLKWEDLDAQRYAVNTYSTSDSIKAGQYALEKDPTNPLPHMKEYKDNRLAQYAQDYKNSPHQSDPINTAVPMAVIGGLGIGATSGLLTSHFVPRNVTQKQLDDANNHMYRTIGLKK